MSAPKHKRGLALNVGELMAATGYGRAAIKRIGPPLVEGKCRLADFWAHVAEKRKPVAGLTQAFPVGESDARELTDEHIEAALPAPWRGITAEKLLML